MLGLESNDLGLVLVAVIGALTTLMGGQKLRDMSKAAPQPGAITEVAGAIVSDRAAREWIKAAERLADILEKHATCLGENTEACRDMADEIAKAAARIGKLATELEIARALADRGGK